MVPPAPERPDASVPPDDDPRDRADDGTGGADFEAQLGRDLGRYMSLGLQFAASVGLFTFGGYWLDGRLGSLPWFTVLGVFLGFVGATVSLVRHVPPVRGKRRKT